MCPDEESDNLPFKTRAGKWLFSQGASTVLLVLILGFLGYGAYRAVPEFFERQAAADKAARDDFKATLTEQRKDFLEAQEKNTGRLEKAIEKLSDKLEK